MSSPCTCGTCPACREREARAALASMDIRASRQWQVAATKMGDLFGDVSLRNYLSAEQAAELVRVLGADWIIHHHRDLRDPDLDKQRDILRDALALLDAERQRADDVVRERDAARAENDRLRALLADIRDSLGAIVARDVVTDPVYDPAVYRFAQMMGGGGYGAIMDATARVWRQRGECPGSEFVVGPCRATVDRWIRGIDAALTPGAKP